jgi:hypothetical protein
MLITGCSHFWAVYDGEELDYECVYRKGAREVVERLGNCRTVIEHLSSAVLRAVSTNARCRR